MRPTLTLKFFSLVLLSTILLSSCKNGFEGGDHVAYFGGEIVNPTVPYVLFCKDNDVLDTLKLDQDNRFFIQFDSLATGLYTFKHEPYHQYVYFDKNDSIMVHANSRDFDQSIIFCGRGDAKNNFLMEYFLKNEEDKKKTFDAFDYPVGKFSKMIDSFHRENQKFYASKKEDIKWSDDFDEYARASVNFSYYCKKELYPLVHRIKTGEDVIEKLPPTFYAYRKNIDYNSVTLSNYAPYVKYLSYMLDNMGAINYHNHFTVEALALKTSINKMKIADTLIKNEKLKNNLLNNIAFTYLLEDQNMVNNKTFFETYHKLSTDKSSKNEITKIGEAIQMLKVGNSLPDVTLMDRQHNEISSSIFDKTKTVIFFWTGNAKFHLIAAHDKVKKLKAKFPAYKFIAININDTEGNWRRMLTSYKLNDIPELHCNDFDDIKNKWAINKIFRTIILDDKGLIKNAFTDLFDSNFEENLK